MKLLIAYGSKGKYFHLKEFCNALSKFGVECKLVRDTEYSVGFPTKQFLLWFSTKKKFKQLIQEFKPDAVFIDRQTQFGVDVIKSKIPLFVLLRGHYWSELYWAKKTIHKTPWIRAAIWFRNRVAQRCFRDATVILPICSYLEKVVKEHYPNQKTEVFFEGIDPSRWYQTEKINLKHPCVGLLQDANWWGKTKEMLILSKIIPAMPDVNFYWAGDGPYREKILSELNKFKNFQWLGRLSYPDKVRQFLGEIDVYALITGMDLAPLTLKEAQLMKKPVVATNVGGVSEMMKDSQTGFLIKEYDFNSWIEKLRLLLNDAKLAERMGNEGRKFVEEMFAWEKIAKKFLIVANKYL